MKKSTESLLNFVGSGELQEEGNMEQEGTSHAQDQAGQEHVVLPMSDGSDSVVSFSAASLLIPAGKEKNEAHPPIRRVRGLTPPSTPAEGKRYPSSERDAKSDPEFEKHLRRPRTREQFKMEIQRLTTAEAQLRSSTNHLEQPVKVQGQCMSRMKIQNKRLEAQCECFAAFVGSLPEDVRAETLLAFAYPVHLQTALNESPQK